MKKVREKEEIMKENVIKFIKNNWRWMLLFICLIGFLALAEDVFHQEIMNGDIVGYDIVSKLFKFNVSTPIAKFMTNFGGAIFEKCKQLKTEDHSPGRPGADRNEHYCL